MEHPGGDDDYRKHEVLVWVLSSDEYQAKVLSGAVTSGSVLRMSALNFGSHPCALPERVTTPDELRAFATTQAVKKKFIGASDSCSWTFATIKPTPQHDDQG